MMMHSRSTPPAANEPKVTTDREIGLFRDIPQWIWTTFLFAWATLFTLFILFFANDGGAAFAVTVATFFVLMAFGLPITMAAQSKCADCEYNGTIETRSGPLSVGAAATQIVLIPVAAVMGLTAFIVLAM